MLVRRFDSASAICAGASLGEDGLRRQDARVSAAETRDHREPRTGRIPPEWVTPYFSPGRRSA
jgi:hypothetical protein